jgi:exodeoxyribonuclease-3
MKIICWNVNGIRANYKKGAFQWLIDQSPEVICLQETKAHPDQLPEEVRSPVGYKSFFDHSKLKKGYSGVAIFSKPKVLSLKDGFDLDKDQIDQEGRFFQVEYKEFVLINCYFPNGGGAKERLEYKLYFYDAFIRHLQSLLKDKKQVIVCGDFNIVHKDIDAKRSKENAGSIGFLPEERQKLDMFVDIGLVDVFRHFYPEKEDSYTWWDMKSYARDRNIGWRIDTFFCTKGILKDIKDIKIHDDVYGSDHCPVSIDISQ